jgi:GNAT superfamily N-acetyltransferase
MSDYSLQEVVVYKYVDVNDEDVAKVEVKRIDGIQWIFSVYVMPGNRGEGLATALLEYVVQRHGHEPLYIQCLPYGGRPLDTAQLALLYNKVGFVATSVPHIMVRMP